MTKTQFTLGQDCYLTHDCLTDGIIKRGRIERGTTGAIIARPIGGFERRIDADVHANQLDAIEFAMALRSSAAALALSQGDPAEAIRLEGLLLEVAS